MTVDRQSQAQLDALAARDAPYAAEHRASVAIAWGPRQMPRNLREAVHYARRAWAAEIPDWMSEGSDDIGPDGNPRMAPPAEAFVFGSADQVEHVEKGDRPLIQYRITPFRATLRAFEVAKDEKLNRQAAIVRAVCRGERPVAAAIAEGIPLWAAADIAELALRSLLEQTSDLVVGLS